ncbi:MAG: hypothetical protein ACOY0T_27240 [Myxococcota bacterium]
MFELSKERVRQIEARGLRELLNALAEEDGALVRGAADPVNALVRALGLHDDERALVRVAMKTLVDDGFLVIGDGAVGLLTLALRRRRRRRGRKRQQARRRTRRSRQHSQRRRQPSVFDNCASAPGYAAERRLKQIRAGGRDLTPLQRVEVRCKASHRIERLHLAESADFSR